MDDDINISLWREIENKISRFGSASKAREFRHKYMDSSITDELFEKVWAIFSAEIRTECEKIYQKYDVDPNEIRKEVKRERSSMPKYPRANAPVKRKARTSGKLIIKELE